MTEKQKARIDEYLDWKYIYKNGKLWHERNWMCSYCGRDNGHMPVYCSCGKKFDKNPMTRLFAMRIFDNRVEKGIPPYSFDKNRIADNQQLWWSFDSCVKPHDTNEKLIPLEEIIEYINKRITG